MRHLLLVLLSVVLVLGRKTPATISPADQGILNKIQQTGTIADLRAMAGGRVVHPNCFIPEGRKSCAPQFIVAGSMKCGTTSLHQYLLSHPQVLPLVNGAKLDGKLILAGKEVRFFNDPTYQNNIKKIGYQRSVEEYLNLFGEITPESDLFTGDSTPMYVSDWRSARRAYAVLPEAKIIILVRNPVDRLYSHVWFMNSLSGESAKKKADTKIIEEFESCSRAGLKVLNSCINDYPRFLDHPSVETAAPIYNCMADLITESKRLKCSTKETEGMCGPSGIGCTGNPVFNSMYALQIVHWKELYGDKLLVINSEDFYQNTSEVMDQITSFIGLRPADWSAFKDIAFNIANDQKAGEGMERFSQNQQGLFIGGAEKEVSTKRYPKLDPSLRESILAEFLPANQALGKLLGKDNFWPLSE